MNIVMINSAIKQLKQLIELNLMDFNYFSLGYIFNRYIIKQHFYLCKCAYGLNSTLYSWMTNVEAFLHLFFMGQTFIFWSFFLLEGIFIFSDEGNKNRNTGLLTTNKLIAFTACNVLPEFTCGTHVITTGMEMSSTLSAVTLEGISKSYFRTFHCNYTILCVNKCSDQPE